MIHQFFEQYRGGFYRLCRHRSHRLGLPCFRALAYDGWCRYHNRMSFDGRCPEDEL